MPRTERPGGAEPFRRRHPEGESLPPYHAARFADEAPAQAAYQQARALIKQQHGANLSTYRIQLDSISHVTVLGAPPSPEFIEQLNAIFAAGEPAVLPPEVIRALAQRRAQMTQRHPGWVERHHKPGKRFRL